MEKYKELIIFLWILVAVIIVIDIILFTICHIVNKKRKKRHTEEIINLQKTIDDLADEDELIQQVQIENNENTNENLFNQLEDNNISEEFLEDYPYKRKMLLTTYEYKFYKQLKPIADKYNLHVMSKVKIIDFISVKRGLPKNECFRFIAKIKQSHVDFVLCNPDNLYPLAVIELDDNTHLSLKAKERDDFKNNVFKAAGIPLYRIMHIDNNLEDIIKNIKNKN